MVAAEVDEGSGRSGPPDDDGLVRGPDRRAGRGASRAAPATYPPTRGLILLECNGNLFTAKPDGTAVRRITTGGGYSGGQWSPDGTKIASSRMWVAKPDGSAHRKVLSRAVPLDWKR